ncbi:MAG: hypothetical protein FWF87_09060, partial [Synergistaceae bacterium]|nr:hypothetical protein [Synergistaceae bacterium]
AAIEGVGKKTFVWNVGDGNFTVNYDNINRVQGDGLAILRFGSGVTPEDVTTYNSGNHLVFQIPNGDGSVAELTFAYANYGKIRYQMDEIQFADGTVLEWSELVDRKVLTGTEGNDTLRTYGLAGEKITVYGLGGDDIIYGGNADEVFVPGRGNNTIYARAAIEGVGKKTFVWNVGDGNFTVNYDNINRVQGDGLAILRFGSGVAPEGITTYNSGNHLVFQIPNGDGSVAELTFAYANYGKIRYQMDEIQFADGTVW